MVKDMDNNIILAIISLFSPIIAAIINAKGPRKYKNIYINFLFLTIGLSLGVLMILYSNKIIDSNNSKQISVYITPCEYTVTSKITKVTESKLKGYEYIFPILYSCTITNLNSTPVTLINYDILFEKLGKEQLFELPCGFFEGETKLTKPFTLQPFESKTLNIIIALPIDETIYKTISNHFDSKNYINIHDTIEYLANNNMNIYGQKIELSMPYRLLNTTLENEPSYYIFLETANRVKLFQGFGKYTVYPIE